MNIETVEIPNGGRVGAKYGAITEALISAGFGRAVRFNSEDYPLLGQNPSGILQWTRRFPGERLRRKKTGNSMTIWREKIEAKGASA